MSYQLYLPGCSPTKPENIGDSVAAFLGDPEFWRDMVCPDYYSLFKNLRKEIKEPFNLNYYPSILSTADRMIENERDSISLFSSNSKDGILDLLERNLDKNQDLYLTKRTEIRVISLNEEDENRFAKYDEELVKLAIGHVSNPKKGLDSFLVCGSSKGNYRSCSLKIDSKSLDFYKLPTNRTSAVFYAYGVSPKADQTCFNAMWDKLKDIPEPEKPKSFPRRVLKKMFG